MEDNQIIQLSFSKRGLVRVASFLSALVLVLAAAAMVWRSRSLRYSTLLEDTYAQSLTGLASNLTGISSTLNKGRFASTPVQISGLSAQLWRDASAAKSALASLPVGELHLDNTNRFLTQVGDYAMSLSRKAVSGTELSRQESEQFAQLCSYGQALAEQFYNMEQQIIAGQVTMEQLEREILAQNDGNGAQPPPGSVIGAFAGMEEAFSGYPALEYDGPFSDHILKREPLMLKGAAAVTPQAALIRAAKGLGTAPAGLKQGNDEASALPAYTFYSEGAWAEVTKAGGYLTSMVKPRLPGAAVLTAEEAVAAAQKYLEEQGLTALVPTYYQLGGGLCTISFAGMQNGVLVYPDQIKVEAALDNGEILGFDARGYLSSHHSRAYTQPRLTAEQAKSKLSRQLTVQSERLAIIPTAGQYEALCYEFSAAAQTGEQVLAYINAETGVEEQLFLLTQNDNGRMVH